jgi:hypothetical protein
LLRCLDQVDDKWLVIEMRNALQEMTEIWVLFGRVMPFNQQL